ncbi:hypothetical protein BC829DRAFT_381848, partial [Chytridium lagenaria]
MVASFFVAILFYLIALVAFYSQDDQDSRATWSKITLFSALAVWLTCVTFPESLRANLVYSSSFYLAIIFGAFTTWDAILQQNLVQVLAIVAYNCGMFIFTSTLSTDNASTKPGDGNVSILRGVQIMLILLTLVWWLCTGFFTYRLYQEFTWSIYRRIGGDIKLEADSRLLTGSFFSALILLGYVECARIFRMYDTRLETTVSPHTAVHEDQDACDFFGVMAIILLLGL